MLHLGIAQFKPRKGAYAQNLVRLGEIFRTIAESKEPLDVLVLSETALTGYFVEGGVRELARTAEELHDDLSRLHREAGAPPFDIVLGFYELWDTRLHNSALVAGLGGTTAGIRHVHRKIFLPTYGVFDEERFVEPGTSVSAFDCRWGRAAAIICEDAWHSLVPTIAALDGAQLIAVVAASPARGLLPGPVDGDGEAEVRPTSLVRWDRTIQGIAAEHGVYVALAQLVGFEGGKGFPGGSLVAGPSGEILARAPVFEDHLLRVTLDLDEIPRVRAEYPLLSDLQSRLPRLLENLGGQPGDRGRGRGDGRAKGVPLPPQPARLGTATDPLAIDPELTRRWLEEFLREELTRRRGFTRAVIALSGGVDSAVVAYLAARALGPEQVTALLLPYKTSSPDSTRHARLVVDQLGIGTETIDITAAVDGLIGRLPDEPNAHRIGNLCARMRMIALFDRSASHGALPIGTGNKSERLLGYFTWHADDTAPINPVGDLYKTQVRALARHLGVPDEIVTKPPSADLVAGQTDEGDFGISYGKADVILHWLLTGHSRASIAKLGFTSDEVELVARRLDSTHWKRKLPTVAMVSGTAIGEFYLRPVDY